MRRRLILRIRRIIRIIRRIISRRHIRIRKEAQLTMRRKYEHRAQGKDTTEGRSGEDRR